MNKIIDDQQFDIKETSHDELFPVMEVFKKAYADKVGMCKFAIATFTPPSPVIPTADKMGIAAFRIFIEKSQRAKTDQKFVVGINFSNFGDMAMIDIVSLDEGFHKDICFEHLTRMKWVMLNEWGLTVDKLDETSRVPFAYVGSHLKITEEGAVALSGTSGDYGDNIFFSDANSIAAYALAACDISLVEGDIKEGGRFVKDILEIMVKHKLKKDFYEKLIDEISAKNPGRKFTSQHIGALLAMKTNDRVIAGGDLFSVLTEEMTSGIMRYVHLSNVVQQIQQQAKE